uniref:Uncharacterized protein n=1 Tax=Avena sativa TaxID=4498 RepID=A0ACD6AHW5_AVESA
MAGTGEQIPKGMTTVGTAWPGSAAQDGSIGDKFLLDLNRPPPVDGGEESWNEAPIAAGTGASPVALDLDRTPVAAGACLACGEGSQQNEAPIAAGTRASPVVLDLDRSPVAGDGGSQDFPPIAAGTEASPIDVEVLPDEEMRNRTGAMRRRRVDFVDLEVGTDQQGGGDARTTSLGRPSGSKRGRVPPVIYNSPDTQKSASYQQNALVPVIGSVADAPPMEPAFTCPVCLNKMEQPCATSCGHVFCEKCIKASIKAQKKCPNCRKKLGPKSFHRIYLPTTADQGLA